MCVIGIVDHAFQNHRSTDFFSGRQETPRRIIARYSPS
jgi:hypothetical protein